MNDPHQAVSAVGVTVSVALAAGMVAQAVARYIGIPGIVLMLVAGVLLGPDVANIVQPELLGPALQILIGFAVAVILFEGGMNLNIKRLKAEALVIRRLLTVGALVTAIGATLCALLFMRWDWRLAVAFGSLAIVTGPTTITPLLRRIKVRHKLETLLEAEGVLIDALGAVVAVVTLEVVLVPLGDSLLKGLLDVVGRMAFGVVAGLISGYAIAALLRRRIVPEGLENVFTLSLVLMAFQVSNALRDETGIVTVTVAGIVVGNIRTSVHRDLLEFKEQLTVLLIGMLFVLLAADVRMEQLLALGWPAVATVATLMLVVRPLNILASTAGAGLTRSEQLFLSWLAPRGVVAAAVATLFAQRFTAAGFEQGKELQALVFLVIAGTVVIQGLSGGLIASLLGLKRGANMGYAILGANELGHALGNLLRDAGEPVLFIDSNPMTCKTVEEDGFRVIYGNALQERTLQRAQIEEHAVCVGATANEEINLLFARAAAKAKVPRVIVAVRRDQSTVSPQVVRESGAQMLFGRARDLDLWSVRLRRKLAPVERWRLGVDPESDGNAPGDEQNPLDFPVGQLLPLVVRTETTAYPYNGGQLPRSGDVVCFAVFSEQREAAHTWLESQGWAPVPDETEAAIEADVVKAT